MLAFLLCFSLVLGIMPASVLALDAPGPDLATDHTCDAAYTTEAFQAADYAPAPTSPKVPAART